MDTMWMDPVTDACRGGLRMPSLALAVALLACACTGGSPRGGGEVSHAPTATVTSSSPAGPPTASYPDFWRTPHDGDPIDPRSAEMMRAIEQAARRPYVFLSGTDGPRWGAPYYEASATEATVAVTCPGPPCYSFPPSGTIRFRIPSDARPSQDTDRELVVIDRTPGTDAVLWLWHACPPHACGTWTAHGISFTSLDSDELDRCWAQHYPGAVPASNLQNVGHRGLPGLYLGIRYGEVATDRSISHALKIAIPDTASSHVYPYVGDEGRGGSIPEGTLMRLKRTVALSSLSPAARVIARALKRYGAVVGDTSGGTVGLKVENLVVEHSPDRWARLRINGESLSKIPLSDFEIVKLGYGAPGPVPASCPTG